MIAALDGAALLVFTGGIGEHDAEVRADICNNLSWFGVSLDPERNQSSEGCISDRRSRCAVRVLFSEEDAQIAVHTAALAHC